MLIRRFENPRAIIRSGYVALTVALLFNFAGRRMLGGVLSEDALDALAGMLHGIAFGLLGLGVWRLSRARSQGGMHHGH